MTHSPRGLQQVVWAYPWDLVDDDAAADEIAALGLTGVSIAAVYHSVRAWSPHNPRRKIVTAPYAATYFQSHADRFAGRLVPAPATWVDGGVEEAIRRARAAGLRVHLWIVALHSS